MQTPSQQSSGQVRDSPVWLHRWAAILAGLVVGLIAAGALVTSMGAGLAVPDWPLSFGTLNPPNWWRIATVRAEHSHRLYAGAVALLTFGLAIAASRVEPRRWVRRLAWTAFAIVLVQALLGGLTVLLFLPLAVSVSHAGTAQLFLCLLVGLACFTAPSWRELRLAAAGRVATRPPVASLAIVTTTAVYLQILVGAVTRHAGAGLAIPDFPLVFGGLVPPHWDFSIAIHYAHRLGAGLVAVLILWTAGRTFRRFPGVRLLTLPALLLELLVVAQIALGGLVVLTGRSVAVNTAHVATGAAILALSLVLALRLYRAESAHGVMATDDRRAATPTSDERRAASSPRLDGLAHRSPLTPRRCRTSP